MSFTLKKGSKAIDFELPATDGNQYRLTDFDKFSFVVVFFTCNHCPYVIGSDDDTARIARTNLPKGVKFIAINSNSKNTYEEDSFPNMVKRMERYKFPWVYLYDESQTVAIQYGALRTPHFFLFDQNRKLIYTGRSIDTPRDYKQATCHDLENALNEAISGNPVSVDKTNPIGCNVKWEGKDKHWMPPDACDLV